MINPKDLKVNYNRSYSFKSPLKNKLIELLDFAGGLIFSKKKVSVPWKKINRIAILRLDHLGDVILSLPALKALEQALPKAQIDFYVGPWAKDIVEIAGLRANTKIFTASWFVRNGNRENTLTSIQKLKESLRTGQYDAAMELRGDFRHIIALYFSGIKYRIGLSRTGFGFLLNNQINYQIGQHEIKRNLTTLMESGINLLNVSEIPKLYPRKEDVQLQNHIRKKLGIHRPFIVVHAISSALSKRWPVSNWQQLVNFLPKQMDIVMVGTEEEKSEIKEIQKGCNREVFSTAGLLNLKALSAFLKESRLFIGVDSGPAHIAAAVGAPVVSLYSGTNEVRQWGPKGEKVVTIQKTPNCSPCELTVCPIGNECMNLIKIEEVIKAVNKYLN